MAVDYETPAGQVRLLINDTQADEIFDAAEIAGLLALEGGSVKRAAALANETIASDEALTSKVIRTQDLSTDGPKTAAALLQVADRWRKQADAADDDGDAGFYFGVIDLDPAPCRPERTQYPSWP